MTINKKLYYFDKDCALVTGGWFCVDKGYYYAGKNGALSTNTVVEGYKLDSKGKSSTKYRIIQYVKQHTNDSMTDQEKIKALYDWVLTNDMVYYRTYEHVAANWVWKASWVDDMAKSQMDNWGGNCFRYASFLGMLVREATGLPVTVYHGTTRNEAPHGWIAVCQEDIWYIYDVELQKHANYSEGKCYKVPVSDSQIHCNGIGTKLY